MREHACVATTRLRTANYTEHQRRRLGEAAVQAREAMGLSRPQFVKAAKAAGITLNVRSLELVESGDPGVGQSFLFALGRMIPTWTQDTPRVILEGGKIPALPEPGAVRTPAERAESPPYEWSASTRRRLIAMSQREVAQVVDHATMMFGEDAGELAYASIMRLREEAAAIAAKNEAP